MFQSTLMLTTVFLLGIAGPAADEEFLPKAEAIIDKYVEATGGKAAYDKISNRVMKGIMESKGIGMKITMTAYYAKPNRNYTLVEMGGVETKEKGTNGKVAWESSGMEGPTIYKGRRKEDFLRDSTFDKWTNWRKLFKKAECKGTAEVDGRTCYEVEVTAKYNETKKEGEAGEKPKTQVLYFDKRTYLLARMDSVKDGPDGSYIQKIHFSDYRKVDGILLPHKMRTMMDGREIITQITSIEQNVELPPDRFDPPEEIKKLLEQEEEG